MVEFRFSGDDTLRSCTGGSYVYSIFLRNLHIDVYLVVIIFNPASRG